MKDPAETTPLQQAYWEGRVESETNIKRLKSLTADLAEALEESLCPNYSEEDATTPRCNGEGQMVVGSSFTGWEFLDEDCPHCTKRKALLALAEEMK